MTLTNGYQVAQQRYEDERAAGIAGATPGTVLGPGGGAYYEGNEYKFRPDTSKAPVDPNSYGGNVALAEDGQWYPTRPANAVDFVAMYEFPDISATPFPVEGYEKIDVAGLAREQAKESFRQFPILAVASTLGGIASAAATTAFNFASYDKFLEEVLPGAKGLIEDTTANVMDMLSGELPADVEQLVRIEAAENARDLGVGNVRAANITARDLGLTSLDMVKFGIAGATDLYRLGSETTRSLMTDPSRIGATYYQGLVNTTQMSPAQRVTAEQNAQQQMIDVDAYNSRERARAQAANNEIAVLRANAEYMNTQNVLNAELQAVDDYNKARAASHFSLGGFGGTAGSIIGGIAGSLIGMPTLGATLGGALGGGLEGGAAGAVTGGVSSFLMGEAVTKGIGAAAGEFKDLWSFLTPAAGSPIKPGPPMLSATVSDGMAAYAASPGGTGVFDVSQIYAGTP